MSSLKGILLVDDSPRDTELALKALEQYNRVTEITDLRDGSEALDYLYRRGEFAHRHGAQPAVILLDLKMPKVDGLEVLRQIKSDAALRAIPVVMMTSSREEQDLLDSYASGVNAYVVKPVRLQEFLAAVQQIGAFWALLNEFPRTNAACPDDQASVFGAETPIN